MIMPILRKQFFRKPNLLSELRFFTFIGLWTKMQTFQRGLYEEALYLSGL